jgi:hypothetical protein
MTRSKEEILSEILKVSDDWRLFYGDIPMPPNLTLANEIARELVLLDMTAVGYAPLWVPQEDLKSIREALTISEQLILKSRQYKHLHRHLSQLIFQVDVNRPLKSDGKHGNSHTNTCGCLDK